MASYTKNTPGAPTSGQYAIADQVTDSVGVVWQCIVAGVGATFIPMAPYFPSGSTTPAAGTLATVTGLTSNEFQCGPFRRTRFILAAMPQAVVNGTEYQGTKIFTFPEGRIYVLGCVASLAETTTSDVASTLNSAVTGALALGTSTASNVALTGAMVDIAPSTAFTTSASTNVAGAAAAPVLAAAAFFDGTGTAKEVYLNSGFATTGDIDLDATMTWTGYIELTWINLGDK